MGDLVIHFSALLFAVGGLALIVSAKRLAGRILVVGVILAVAAGAIGHRPTSLEATDVHR